MFLGSNIHVGNVTLAYVSANVDDFTYVLRLEAENASRHGVEAKINAALDGNNGISLDGSSWIDTDLLGDIATDEDFTFNFIVNASVWDATNDMFFEYGNYLGSNGVTLQYSNSSGRLKVFINGGSEDLGDDISLPTGVDIHLALIRSSGTLYLCKDGVALNSVANVESVTSAGLRVGGDVYNSGAEAITGTIYRFEFRRDARWSTFPFTPPSKATELDVVATSELALNFDGAAASTRILDSAVPDNAGSVPILPDTGGNGYDATQAVAASQPAYDATKVALTFDGTDDYLAGAIASQSQPFTAYMVADVPTGASVRTLFGSALARISFTASDLLTADTGTTPSQSTISSESSQVGSKILISAVFNGASSELYVDGVRVATGTLDANSLSNFGLGADNAGGDPVAMDFYACFVTTGAYSPEVNSAIATKYGV